MERVTIFLKTALFTYSTDARHVPVGATVIEGKIAEHPGGALKVEIQKLLDERGRVLSNEKQTILLPWGKIDHIALPS